LKSGPNLGLSANSDYEIVPNALLYAFYFVEATDWDVHNFVI
jgi:hypothetical protein